ncbi:hypothetical protein DL95DRAFT_512203 [Leptodontidium sp. 2 PMI_412]|nr:hypothetical protein DL95DRAFT_512203 [Leptodontidium sp. 2 PMI_412]
MITSPPKIERHDAPSRKWRCSQCPKKFARQDHLQRHERAHTHARPFVCTHCSKSFSRRDVLLRHIAQVHEIVPESKPFEEFLSRNLERSADKQAPRTPISSSPFSVPSDLDEILAICSDPIIWTDRERKTGRSRRNSASLGLATTKPLPRRGEYTEDWKAPIASTAQSPTFPVLVDITGEFPRPKVQDSLAAFGALGPPEADMVFLLGLDSWKGTTSAVMNLDRRDSIGANGHVSHRPNISSPLADLAYGLGKCLDTPNIEALIAIYTGHFMPNLPFVHLRTLDLDSVLSAEFPKANQVLSAGISVDGRRPFYKPLFLAMLSHGAAYTSQPILARRLHQEAAKAIRSDLSALSLMGVTKAPLYIIQAMIHQIHLGFSFGDLVLEESTLGHVYSLMALVKDAMLSKPSTHPRARLSSQSVQTHHDWLEWVEVEERKRTFFAVMIVMSATLTMFDSASLIDIQSTQLALPCQEFLWEAETVWAFKTGISMDPEAPPLFQDEYGSLFKGEEDLVACDCNSDCYTDFAHNACGGTACGRRPKENLSGFGCLILISALSQTIIKWNQCRKNGSNDDLHARDIFRCALSRWRARWKSLEEVSFNSSQYRLLINCMPMLDHAELLLKVDITLAKEALHRRRYGDVGAYVNMMELHSNHNNSASSRYPDNDFLNAYDLGPSCTSDDMLLYDAALYSANAIRLSMQKGPWWSYKKASVDLPLHTAVIAFHCTQILCTWLLFLHKKSLTPNGLFYRLDSEVKNDDMLLGLCKKLAERSFRQLDDNFQTQQNLNDNAMPLALALALTLAQPLANFFQKQSAWPVLNHLATSLQVRITGISDRAQPPDSP